MSEVLTGLPNAQLLARVRELVRRGNAVEADLLVHLGEVDARQLYLEEGCSSMFTYCRNVLHFAEGVAYKRIQAARAARRHPQVLEALRCGDLHLTAVGLLAPKLIDDNCAELIGASRHLGADEIKRMLADREPKPSAPAFVRRIHEPIVPPAAAAAPPLVRAAPATLTPTLAPAAAPAQRAHAEPLGGGRYRVQFTPDRETHAQLEELRALMLHQVPDGDVGKILAKAISVLIEKVASRSSPKPPIAAITLRCRPHNQLRARQDFGEKHMARFGRTGFKSSSQISGGAVRRDGSDGLMIPT